MTTNHPNTRANVGPQVGSKKGTLKFKDRFALGEWIQRHKDECMKKEDKILVDVASKDLGFPVTVSTFQATRCDLGLRKYTPKRPRQKAPVPTKCGSCEVIAQMVAGLYLEQNRPIPEKLLAILPESGC